MMSLSHRISRSELPRRVAKAVASPSHEEDEEVLVPLSRFCLLLLRFEGDLEAPFTVAAA
jgi:hypothetical protein